MNQSMPIFILLLSFITTPIFSAPFSDAYWASAGFIIAPDKNSGYAINTTFLRGIHGFSLDYYLTHEAIFPLSEPPQNVLHEVKSGSLCYNLNYHNSTFRIILYTGISYSRIEWRGQLLKTEYEEPIGFASFPIFTFDDKTYYTFGIPFGLQFILHPLKYFGIGTRVYAGFHENPDMGLIFQLFAGKLK